MPPLITDTPTGFQLANPVETLTKSIVLDLKCSVASARMLRNLLATRVGLRSPSNTYVNTSFTLTSATPYTHTLPASATGLVLVSNRKVQLTVTNANGTLNLGEGTMFVFTSNLTLVSVANLQFADGAAEVNLISI